MTRQLALFRWRLQGSEDRMPAAKHVQIRDGGKVNVCRKTGDQFVSSIYMRGVEPIVLRLAELCKRMQMYTTEAFQATQESNVSFQDPAATHSTIEHRHIAFHEESYGRFLTQKEKAERGSPRVTHGCHEADPDPYPADPYPGPAWVSGRLICNQNNRAKARDHGTGTATIQQWQPVPIPPG
ncbi:hypothetical protein ARMSODRAFT_980628 [Armillaria solidipes]|uniref:Uncharacterized protein n=1 Tax=Armillaria solidipes TaxID=1076256 RepID=A0A2H3BDA5_9AGAR|nr:hypothetical protein ARMSODRAFT_980628 [Armillaria solidipes]